MKLLQDADLKDKRVFLRVDFNVPMKNGLIEDDNRIEASLPTIKYIIDHGGKIVIGTHLGRPEGETDLSLSLWPIAKRLGELLKLKSDFSAPEEEYRLSPDIILLENLRFDDREEENDSEYAKELADIATSSDGSAGIFVNDAFAVSHRANASVDAITKYLPSYAGLLLQKEVEHLSQIKDDPKKPFVLIIGGIKVKDKVSVISSLGHLADKILLGGGIANTFLKAKGEDIGKSIYDTETVHLCKEMLAKYADKILLPTDFSKEYLLSGSFKIMDIGKETRKLFAEKISSAGTVFWNGSLGYSEDKRYEEGMIEIAEAMSKCKGMTVIAGGDTVGFVKEKKLDKNITFLSTGGGAALEYLAGEKLPGIEALN